ncbi:RutC family protein [Allomyces macrogynus ATCC 38327]|uniref:RutC family protein n=1 Tax=Allomyces macrogynus (strain ATCC 38327) TaxID=578462 RepID=A0A0L0SAE1_ALLM3|nr:RutC family protein [Allomyces macrogynus ATCC 38327]|eukprot:KNE59374.1 RutC family protein [Allomyces macrogynus ATCC 38327]
MSLGPRSHVFLGDYIAQAVVANGFVFCSGQIPLDPKTVEVVLGGVEEQTRQVLISLQAVLEAAGSDLEHVAKTLVFLKDMNSFAAMNQVYEEYFFAPQAGARCCRGRAAA